MEEVNIVGGGLAGAEAAWQIARRGLRVVLHEMRPSKMTGAHSTDLLAELVCSNSLGSNLPDRAPGLLKTELRHLSSLVLQCADVCAVPAGGALAVDREAFSSCVTAQLANHPLVEIRHDEVTRLPKAAGGYAAPLTIIASGPLTSEGLAAEIASITGSGQLYFYDAVAPIVLADSLDQSKVFRAARYGRGADDYVNCPMTREEYEGFVEALLTAETIPLRAFERTDKRFFEACLPVEIIASRGREALAFGPLRPVGLIDPRTGRRPWAVVQLRQDNLAGTLYNLVGFQTNLRWPEQQRVFRLIPGLDHAEFVRFGQMHRNTFINSPALLAPTMQMRTDPSVLFAGQLVGSEGYVAAAATGLVAGLNTARVARGQSPLVFPPTTMLGALCRYIASADASNFQPMKPNFGLLPALTQPTKKKEVHQALVERAMTDLSAFLDHIVDF